MRVLGLRAENVKRLSIVEIRPTDDAIIIGGENEAGKSSVLDAVAMALGGADLAPTEPIRQGEDHATIRLDLGDYVVVRRFVRERLTGDAVAAIGHVEWGPTRSTLEVRSPDGTAKYSSPQALLDRIVGKLTFDPLEFSRLKPVEQRATLARIAGVDTATIDRQIAGTVNRRTEVARAHKTAVAVESQLPRYPDAPEEEISADAIGRELLNADQLRKDAAIKRQDAKTACDAVLQHQRALNATEDEISDLTVKLNRAKERLQTLESELDQVRQTAHDRVAAAEAAEQLVPDTAVLQARVTEIEEINRRVRANAKALDAKRDVQNARNDLDGLEQKIDQLRQQKIDTIAAAKFPIDGLALSDDGVTFNGVPFEQCSTSQRLRVSVAVGLALNPTLRVLLIRDGNALDPKNMRALIEQAKTADAQLWIEYVTDSAEGVSVFIEDGRVRA